MRRLLLDPRVVLVLISLLAAAVGAGLLFPQRFNATPLELSEWQTSFPLLNRLAITLALDHIYTSPWFGGLLGLLLLIMILSVEGQIKNAIRKTTGPGCAVGGLETMVDCRPDPLIRVARRYGYRVCWTGAGAWRLVKNPWGYWGDPLLHLGMLVVIGASILCALTQLRGVVRLTEGEVVPAGTTLSAEESGPLAGAGYLPEAVRLEEVLPEFWSTDELRDLRATITFLGSEGRPASHGLAVNHSLRFRGRRIDLSRTFGRSFFVTLNQARQRPIGIRLDLGRPPGRGVASYGNFSFTGVPTAVEAKYYGDVSGQKVDGDAPRLVIRLVAEDLLPSEVALTPGQRGQLGPYTASLVKSVRWVDLTITELQGIPLLFSGFMIIVLGCWFIYCMPPRELHIRQVAGRSALRWMAGRFADFYGLELTDILREGLSGTAHE